jgi:hypothetical protein
MVYSDRPIGDVVERSVVVPTADYHDRVRWGPVIAGLVIALSTQLILSALGAAIGATAVAGSGTPQSDAGAAASAVGIWATISLLISLFLGGWLAAQACGPMNRSTALLNGAILWATTLALGSWLLASGVTGAFGIAASNAGDVIGQVQSGAVDIPGNVTNVTPGEAQDIAGNAARVGWSFVIGSLLGLVAALAGASIGVRKPRPTSVVR